MVEYDKPGKIELQNENLPKSLEDWGQCILHLPIKSKDDCVQYKFLKQLKRCSALKQPLAFYDRDKI